MFSREKKFNDSKRGAISPNFLNSVDGLEAASYKLDKVRKRINKEIR